MTRNEREKLRLRKKRRDPAYLRRERRANQKRMRVRRQTPEYQQLEREHRWWQKR